MYYDNPERWAFTFQAAAFLTLTTSQSQIDEARIKVMERSIYSTRYCFIENLCHSGKINKMEYKILDDLFQMVINKETCHVDLISK